MSYVPVVYLFGWLLAIMSGFTLIPAAIALNFNETRAFTSFVLGGTSMAFFGGLLILGLWGRVTSISRSQSLILLTSVWLFIPAFASIPLYFSGHTDNWISAFFETVSGFTTTGATIFENVSELPNSVLAWRALLQWLGGLLTLLGLAFLYGTSQVRSFQDTSVSLRGKSRTGGAWFSNAAFKAVLPLYLIFTALCFTLLVFTGIPTFDAFCIAMSTVSSGCFMPTNGTIQSYGTVSALPVLIVFMYFSAVSVFWVRRLFSTRKFERDRQREPLWVLSAIVIISLPLIFQLAIKDPEPEAFAFLSDILFGLAAATSLVTTTGFMVTDQLADAFPYIILLSVCFVGGGRMSTAGGLKFHRMGAMLHHSGQELRRLIYPHGIVSEAISSFQRGKDPMRTIWVNFALVLLIMTASTTVLSLAGLSLSSALLATVSSMSNIGPAYNFIAVPGDSLAATYGELETFAQMNLTFVMIAGRIEILALLSLINFAYWQN